MPHLWKQTIQIDTKLATQLIEGQQGIQVDAIKILEEGWDNIAFLINKALIFRFPRRDFGVPCMENECTVLPYIAQQVSFPLPAPRWIGKPSEKYPYPYMGYTLLPGKPLTEISDHCIDNKQFAENLAHWLKALHRIPVRPTDQEHFKNFLDMKFDIKRRVKRSHENIEHYEHFFIDAGFDISTLIECIDRIGQFTLGPNPKVYIHGDLYHRHIIVDDTLSLAGLIDWGDVCLSHPGIDLAVGMIFTHDVFENFLQAYGNVDLEMRQVLLMQAFAQCMSFLPYAFEVNKAQLKHWAIMELKRAMEEIKACQ